MMTISGNLPFCVMTSQCVYVVTHKTELRSNSSNNLPGFEYLNFVIIGAIIMKPVTFGIIYLGVSI